MSKIIYYVGIDIAAESFAVTIYQSPKQKMITKENIANNIDGFNELNLWLKQNHVMPNNSIICMETTGVYCEAIAYYLTANNFSVAIEHALKVKRSFDASGHKTDAVDSQQIAEYSFRFKDELRFWKPKNDILEKIKQLLTAREQFVKQKTATSNEIHAYNRHVVQVPLITKTLKDALKQSKQSIDAIEKELNKYIHKDLDILKSVNILESICGFGTLLSANIITITDNFQDIPNHKVLAAYVGIAPFKCRSGSSLNKKDKSRRKGPSRLRKLLRLSAQSVATHDKSFRKYYLRKLEEGKNKPLVLNNIANKLIKIAYAMIKNDTNYIKNYKSIHPMYV